MSKLKARPSCSSVWRTLDRKLTIIGSEATSVSSKSRPDPFSTAESPRDLAGDAANGLLVAAFPQHDAIA
jgi:hypothetical protein